MWERETLGQEVSLILNQAIQFFISFISINFPFLSRGSQTLSQTTFIFLLFNDIMEFNHLLGMLKFCVVRTILAWIKIIWIF